MRNYKISRQGCFVLFLLVALAPSHRLLANGEELASADDEISQSVPEDSGSTERLGIGKFSSLPFRVNVTVRGGYDDNVLTSNTDRLGSPFVNTNLALTYNFGNQRLAINLETNGGITDYFDQPGGVNYDFNPNINFSITYKASPRLTLSETTYATYQNQPDFTYNAGSNRRSGAFFFSTNKFSAAYRWRPRFSTVTSFTLNTINYDDAANASFQNRAELIFGNEFRFLVWPTTSVIAEYRLEIQDYENSIRDSSSHFFLGGLDHSFSPRFNISTRAGVEIRSYDNVDSTRANPYFEGNLTYALGPHFSLAWQNRYSIEEADVQGSPGVTTFRSGLTGSYKVTARIVATLNASYTHDVYDQSIIFIFVQPGFTEDSLATSLNLHYALNHTWGLDLGWDFTDVLSDISLREYYRNRFYGGVTFTF